MLLDRHKEDGARFILREGFRDDCINWTAEGVCDLGVVTMDLNDEKEFRQMLKLRHLSCEIICRPKTRVVIGAGHPLYHTDVTEVSYRDMAKYPFVTYDDAEARSYLRSAYIHAAVDNLRVITTDRASLHEMMEFTDSYSVGFSTDAVYQNIPPAPRTRLLTLKDSKLTHTIVCISSTAFEETHLAREFVDLCADLCNDPDFWKHHPKEDGT
jgi:DNA-binding transcriptional LysR family regulator